MDNKDLLNADGVEDEEVGRQFLENIHNWPLWKQTSYNTAFGVHKAGGTPLRGNYAGIGFTYDETNDVFIPIQPNIVGKTFTLNTDTWLWEQN